MQKTGYNEESRKGDAGMEKRIFIINGSGGAGKDTVCAMAAERYAVRNISSITPIVEIARFAGWDGEKTPAARRMLSRLKEVFTEYNDLSLRYCMDALHAFQQSASDQILFVHIREAEEIARFRAAAGSSCRTLLIRRASLTARGKLGNRSDDCVEAYAYDAVIENDGTLEQLRERVHAFLEASFAETAKGQQHKT